MLLPLLLSLLLASNYCHRCCRGCEIVGKQLGCHGAGLVSLQRLPSPSRNVSTVDLSSNRLGDLPARAFDNFPNVQALLLGNNRLRLIHDDAFGNLTKLQVLDLDGNYLLEVPRAVSRLSNLKELSLSNNRIEALGAESFGMARNLSSLDLRANPIKELHDNTFRHMSQLRKLIISNTKVLGEFPMLRDCKSLEMLRIDRAQIEHVPRELCRHSPKLKSLEFKTNRITAIPNLKDCHDLRVLDLANNRISSLDGRPFEGSSALHDLLMAKNAIKTIPKDAFIGLARLQVLDLESNLIDFVHPEAFSPIDQLQDLNLGNNIFPELPIAGLSGILHLKTFNNPALREFPGPERFPRVKTMLLSYAYHCCSYVGDNYNEHDEAQSLGDELGANIAQESVLFPSDNDFDMSLWNSNVTDIWPLLNFTYPGNLPAYVEEYFEDQEGQTSAPRVRTAKPIRCLPEPGPFLPCRDLFDWWTLRCGVWIVFLLAMLGNGTVVFVLIFSRSKMDVPRFLVCNLAAADFFMGLYLGLLAVVDAATLGEFRKYAIPWQTSAGCQTAGFLGVLSSELSVYTLAVITLERNYAITHAMHLNKRLSLRHASYIMSFGWLFSLGTASMPLAGVSDYRKFAICLPFETTTPSALAYVVFLMLVNGLAFLILMGCYLKMYCAIRGSQAWNSNDSRIAKRMALLVFTDFLCWSPIAFFSLTATFGLQLVSLEQAKVFAVFVLPLNSCCNPFLYAILTKQFKKDCVLICKAIEESRVSRGVGRCRLGSEPGARPGLARAAGPPPGPAERRRRPPRPARHGPGCPYATAGPAPPEPPVARCWRDKLAWPCARARRRGGAAPADAYACRAAELQQRQHKRASSMSSSDNYSSSRSDSWRQNQCGIPLRFLEPRRRGSSWLMTRKPSQDSNLSSSRNDSSGSGTTASTGTWRMSRSSASAEASRPKPRLARQHAVQEPDSPGSPGRLLVRLLATIPSAAEMSEQCDDEESPALPALPAHEPRPPDDKDS